MDSASVDGERRSIDVYHAITGAHIASTDVPAPIVSQPTAASKVWSQSPVFEVLNAGAMGVFARRESASGALARAYRCSIHVPSPLAKIVEPVVLDPTAHGVERIDRLLAEMKSFGGCIEPLSHALAMARKEAETASPRRSKRSADASDSLAETRARVVFVRAGAPRSRHVSPTIRRRHRRGEMEFCGEGSHRGDSRTPRAETARFRVSRAKTWTRRATFCSSGFATAARASATSTARETETSSATHNLHLCARTRDSARRETPSRARG